MKKVIVVLLILAVLLTGCSSAFSVEEADFANRTKITFQLTITDESGGEVYNNEIAYSTGSYSLYIPILEVLREEGISYSEVLGDYDDFFGTPSLDDKKWVLYVNEEQKDFNNLTKVAAEDEVLIAYE